MTGWQAQRGNIIPFTYTLRRCAFCSQLRMGDPGYHNINPLLQRPHVRC